MAAGHFVWHELMTTDVDAAIAFYGEVCGWKTMPFEGGPKPYTMFCVGDQPIGGVMTLPDEAKAHGAPPHWMGHVEVADLEAAKAKVTEGGGQVAFEQAIPTVGKFAITRDPQGAVLSCFQPENTMEPIDNAPGYITWNELNTTDWEAAWKYYSTVLGWKEESKFDMGPDMGTYFMWTADGLKSAHMGGMSNMATVMGAPPFWIYYIETDDIDATAARVTGNGGSITVPVKDIPGGKIVVCKDPQGVDFAMHWADPNHK